MTIINSPIEVSVIRRFNPSPKLAFHAWLDREMVRREPSYDLTLNHESHPDWADYADRTKAAWGKMLEILFNRLEKSSQR